LSNTNSSVASLSTALSAGTSGLQSSITAVDNRVTGVSLSTSIAVGSLSTGLSSTTSQVQTLSTTLVPLTQAQTMAVQRGGSIAATVTGGGTNTTGVVTTQGRTFNNQTVNPVQASDCLVANGVDTTATGTCASAGTMIGVNGAQQTTVASGATAYGSQSLAQDKNTTAIGFRATATNEGSVAVGYQAQAIADPATAVGWNSLASGNQSSALGAAAQATGTNATALGAGAQATADNSVALGANSVANQPDTVSVGSPGAERRITNVAPGVSGTDAVNMNQLQRVSRIAYSGVAMSMAMSGTYLPTLGPGEKAMGVGLGVFRNQSALSLNFKSIADDGRMSWGAGIATTGKEWGVNVGVGWKWK
ncbi:YadA-like family protein, partial [Ottowia sp.]|uniref:YadA family autotransporter adhesin n=1 Tax=Ottowia sp. TaxID=1898956 RepID=UPI002CAFCE86